MSKNTANATIRKFLLLIFILGVLASGSELVLLDHMEDIWQWIPLMLLACSLLGLGALAAFRRPASIYVFRCIMGLFVIGGMLGLYLHYQGNAEFELEMYPDMGGFELVRESLTGATPALPPGTMIMLGLMGLTYTFRHPVLNNNQD